MNALVSGGTGFIGSALVGRLLKDGNKVIILTRDKKKVNNSLNNIEVLQADMCNLFSLERIDLSSRNIDIIFHLAAALDYFGDKRRLFQVNVEGTIGLLNCAERNGIKKFIFASSIEAMGTMRKDEIPADESLPCKPISTYGASKLEAEKQIKKFTEARDLDITILRLANVYGIGSPVFIVSIANAILRKDNLLKFLPVYRNRYLHPVYIDDVIDGIVKAAQKSDIDKTYILAGGEYITIGALFILVAQELNVDIDSQIKKKVENVLYLNLRNKLFKLRKRADLLTYFMVGEGERMHRAYTVEKAKRELDYSPKVNLKEGIAKTIEWAKKKGLLAK